MIEYVSLAKRMQMHSEDIKTAVERVVNSGWYLLGRELEAFEKEYAQFLDTPYCIGVGNGLDSLTLIYRAYIEMGLMAPGDEVIVPANTYIASILAVTENGLVPVPVEPRADTMQIDGSLIERHITDKTRSVMVVHLYGRCAYTDEIGAICSDHNLLLVEDNAQAHGCSFKGRFTGTFGDAAGHSFYPTKNLGAMGDAGAVTTKDKALANMVRSLRNYGSCHKYVFDYKGRNSRMDEIQAAVLRVKLAHLQEDNARRQAIAQYYIENIRNDAVTLPAAPSRPEENVWHIFPVLCEDRDAFMRHLAKMGVMTQIHYPIAPHKQKCMGEWSGLALPITEKIHDTEVSLPNGPELSDSEVKQIVKAVNSFQKE